MTWPENKVKAAALLGLDPENPQHRAALEECVKKVLKKKPRGRPKGTSLSDEELAGFALFVDAINPLLSEAVNAAVSDREALKFVTGTFPGRAVRCDEPEMDTVLISWSPKFYPTSCNELEFPRHG